MRRAQPMIGDSLRARGFTLIELVVVIVITGIVATFVAIFLITPVQNYFAQTQRGTLVSSASLIQRNLTFDVASALPGSLRSGGGGGITALEMLEVADTTDYWGATATGPSMPASPPAGGTTFTAGTALTSFSTLGQFPAAVSGLYHVAVGFTGPGTAYAQTGVMTPLWSIQLTANGITDTVSWPTAPPFTFTTLSSTRHVFLVSGPITYLCDTAAQTLTRYDSYGVTLAQMTTAAQFIAAGARRALIAQGITACPLVIVQATSTTVDRMGWRFDLVNGSATMTAWVQAAVRQLP